MDTARIIAMLQNVMQHNTTTGNDKNNTTTTNHDKTHTTKDHDKTHTTKDSSSALKPINSDQYSLWELSMSEQSER